MKRMDKTPALLFYTSSKGKLNNVFGNGLEG